mmetsp:Transcript_32912/g.86158  ORF Transcript_32912/g.86158 Transcript_32912/m.86158 type:complete len:88 (-) Transcript_32912:656-919(-)
MELKVLLFAEAREVVGKSETTVVVENDVAVDAPSLLALLVKAMPNLGPIAGSVVLALNEDYIDMHSKDALTLKDKDTIAVIPPLSGG